MATWTFPSRVYNPGSTVLDVTGQLPTETWAEFELTATTWAAGRQLVANIEESFDSGTTWKHAAGGTWNGPLPTDGSVVAGVGVNVPEQADRANYRIRIALTLSGGNIRCAITLVTR